MGIATVGATGCGPSRASIEASDTNKRCGFGTPSSSAPSSSVPSVSASFNDSGVTILPSAGRVTISGQYNQSHSISWQYLDLTGAVKTSDTPPETGTFSKITKVDSPPRLIETCVYTIAGQTFTHTITIVSYDPIANTLKSLLAEVV
jgi:hypothetical protein